MKPLHIPPFLILLFFTQALHANDSVVNYNQISLDASASEEVDNDTMIVSLYVQEEGSKASVLSDRVNKRINAALKRIEQYPSVKVETESYSTNPVYNNSKIVAWRVRQSIKLESRDLALLSELLGELQRQLKLSSIGFDVSRDKREEYTKRLIDKALSAFSERAGQIARQLEFSSYKIVNMNVSTSGSNPHYKHRAMTAMMADTEASVAAPAIAGGKRTLSVRVSGTIELE